MRVAVVVRSFPTISETFILRQVTGLLDRGHDVQVFAMERDGSSTVHSTVGRYGLMERTRFVDAPPASGFWEQPVRPLHGKTWLPGAERPLLNVVRAARAVPALATCAARAPRCTREVLRRSEYGYQADSLSSMYRLRTLSSSPAGYDVVHAHYGPVGDAFRFARRLWDAPLVVSFHGHDLTRWPRENGAGVYRKLFRDATTVTANGEYAAPRLVSLGCDPARIRVLRYGVDVEQFALRPRRTSAPLRILTVGRLVEKKGIEYSLRAVARLRESVPELRYDIVGDGPLRERFEQLIAELQLDDHAVLHGARTDQEIRRYMDEADIFILTSVTAEDGDEEGTPVSLLEAQSCGLPVVSTHHAGIPEIVADGVSGHLVAERDVDAITDSLRRLVADPESAEEMGRAGRRLIEERFTADRSIDTLEAIYREAVGA